MTTPIKSEVGGMICDLRAEDEFLSPKHIKDLQNQTVSAESKSYQLVYQLKRIIQKQRKVISTNTLFPLELEICEIPSNYSHLILKF